MNPPRAHAGAAILTMWVAATAIQAIGAAPRGDGPLPQRLHETGLYAAATGPAIDSSNRSFSPQYPLWTDGATKRRWVYLPPGGVIDGADEASWVMPAGTKFWKEFSFNGRRVETRMTWKVTATRWVFAAYQWNDEGTEATLASDGGVPGVADVAPGKRHSIPAVTDCVACHGTKNQRPLGFTALQLSPDRDPNALHGEPLDSTMLTVTSLVGDRLLISTREDIVANPPRIKTADASTRAVTGYLLTNCGSCHNGQDEIAALGPTLKLGELLKDGNAVARRLVGQRTSWTVPGVPRGESVVIDATTPELSAMLVRMRSRRPSSQMPPLGTVVRDEAAVAAIDAWIRALPAAHQARIAQ